MYRLAGIIFAMVATTLMGIAIVAALVIGKDTAQPIMAAAALGFVAAVPITWAISRRIAGR